MPRRHAFHRHVLGALALSAAGLSSCANVPTYATEIGDVLARADDPLVAAELAERAWYERRELEQRLPGTREGGVELTVRPPAEMPGPYAHGYTETPGFGAVRNESGTRVVLSSAADPAVLTHELVHSQLGHVWSLLPPVLEEGLADRLAFELHPDSYLQVERWQAAVWRVVEVQVEHVLAIGGTREAGAFTLRLVPGPESAPFGPQDALDMPAAIAFRSADAALGNRFYGLGLALVTRLDERIGLAGLHAVLENAHDAGAHELAPEDLWALLGDPADPLPRPWLEERLAAALERSLLDFPEIEELVAERFAAARRIEPSCTTDEFASALSLRLSIDGGFWSSWRELPGYQGLIADLESGPLRAEALAAQKPSWNLSPASAPASASTSSSSTSVFE